MAPVTAGIRIAEPSQRVDLFSGSGHPPNVSAFSAPRLSSVAFTYDTDHQQAILFGMAASPPSESLGNFAETWAWQAGSWRQLVVSNPLPMLNPGMAYDEVRHQIVLFGGWPGQGAETWTWDGRAWTHRAPARYPTHTDGGLLAFDAKLGRVVALTFNDFQGETETWAWDGSTWTRLDLSIEPPASQFQNAALKGAMVYDAANATIVLYGRSACKNAVSCVEDPDTWVFDGTSWARHAAVAGGPRGRNSLAMAYDATSQSVVMYGGRVGSVNDLSGLGDTWSWDGNVWTRAHPSDSPAPRGSAHATYDAAVGAVLLYGGELRDLDEARYFDTWKWAGSEWALLQPSTVEAPAELRDVLVQTAASDPSLPPLTCPPGSQQCSTMSLQGQPMLGLQGGAYVVFQMPVGWARGPTCISYVEWDPLDVGGWRLINVRCGSPEHLPQLGRTTFVRAAPCAYARVYPNTGDAVTCLRNGTPVFLDDGPEVGNVGGDRLRIWWHVRGTGWILHDLLGP